MNKYTAWNMLQLVNHYNALKDGIELRQYRLGDWKHQKASDERDLLEKQLAEMQEEYSTIERFFKRAGIIA